MVVPGDPDKTKGKAVIIGSRLNGKTGSSESKQYRILWQNFTAKAR